MSPNEVVQLRWEWEVRLPGQEKSVFVIPARIVKNKSDRVVILNDVAQSVIESLRGKHGTFVFTRDGMPSRGSTTRAGRRRDGALQNVCGGDRSALCSGLPVHAGARSK